MLAQQCVEPQVPSPAPSTLSVVVCACCLSVEAVESEDLRFSVILLAISEFETSLG